MNNNLVYYFASGVIVLQYLFALLLGRLLEVSYENINIAFSIVFFLYLIKRVYMFETSLIWEEIKKHILCFLQYLVFISISTITTNSYLTIWKLYLLGIFYTIFSLIIFKMIRVKFIDKLKKNLLIVGVGKEAMDLQQVISQNNFTMYNLLGFLSLDQVRKEKIEVDRERVLGSYKEIDFIKEEIEIDEIIIAVPNLNDSEMSEILDSFEGKVPKIKFIPKINRMYTINPEIQDYDGIMMISVKNKILSRKRKIIKRGMDICFGVAGIILLMPLSIIIWFKTERGERKNGIFFSQPRIGTKGESIKIYKYRSMVHGADDILKEIMEKDPILREEYQTYKKLKNDPRITEIGEFLRRTSLDEFPQFINVLKGEMSFIGPRPYLFREIEDMGNSYKKIIELKPGITGMWQTHGRSDTDFQERLILDEYYYRNWSIWLDIVIFIKTIKNVLMKKGAC